MVQKPYQFSMGRLTRQTGRLGGAPVFLTSISTILGAILFLRFGWAAGNVGFLGAVGIVLIAHLVTIPTAMAISEIATNQKVEGGGEYFIISRSFGLNIGGSIGLALFMSQAISLAFYVIAFAEAFDPVLSWLNDTYGLNLTDKRIVSVPAMLILSLLILARGANIGIGALYVIAGILFISLAMFFMGRTEYMETAPFQSMNTVSNSVPFFLVFAIVFPAFTGMTAGVGLSGDLRNPRKAIPIGTLGGTMAGMIIYLFIAYKFTISASPEDLTGKQLIMADIAIWAPIIPIGLGAATISSAIGSILVAPRTLQALSADRILPRGISNWLARGKGKNNEPFNAGLVTSAIALLFVAMGNVNTVARIISMFFMVTYGAICLISFLQHFAADPSYRPSFRSKWYLSLIGFLMTIYLMFKMDTFYAIMSIAVMVLIYLGITQTKRDKEGLAKIFQGVIFQISRKLQIFLQTAEKDSDNWRPSVICISEDSFKRTSAFNFIRWVSHRYGFGTYIHYITGYYSRETHRESVNELKRLIKVSEGVGSNVYVDTMISPSMTSAMAQSIQLPSVSGKDINTVLFEYSKDHKESIPQILESIKLVKSAELDILILGSSDRNFGIKSNIHIWLSKNDMVNGPLMILMSYVIMGHPEWNDAKVTIYIMLPETEITEFEEDLKEKIKKGRLPISERSIELIEKKEGISTKEIICTKSQDADLVVMGVRPEVLKQLGVEVFQGLDSVGDVLFVNSHEEKQLE